MKKTTYFAHSGTPDNFSDWQPLKDHLVSVGELAAQYASHFCGQDLARHAGLLHDLGKYCNEFMGRLQGGTQRVDHATAGAQVASERWPSPIGLALSFCIAGHHAGLANGKGEGDGRSTLEVRLKLKHGAGGLPVLDEIWKQDITLNEKLVPPKIKRADQPIEQGFQLAFLTRMIFSCLIDADRTDTSQYYDMLNGKRSESKPKATLEQLHARLAEKLNQFPAQQINQKPGSINALRQHILQHSIASAQQEPGLFSLTVPTGGGKTYTSMAFALEHALKHQATHQFRRIIYVIPFTSIIEQNAKVFKEAFGDLSEAVLEHHSAFDASQIKTQTAKDTLKVSMESWDSPVIVTTAVQFFESLFADRPAQCRKLHNIAGSVIVLDEAQTLPLKLLRPIMAAISELARNYKCTVVLCTATQPALREDQGFFNGFKNVREIAPLTAPSGKTLFEELERVKISFIGSKTDDELVQELEAREQVLMIVNNRRHARELFSRIQHMPGATHLTTLMCAKHRSSVLHKVRENLLDGKPCRLISTSLIEAGVDVDFPCVFRAQAGLDSIAQAAGRCNREGKRQAQDSDVFIFESPEWKAPPEMEDYASCMREIVRNHAGNLLAPESIKAYFKLLYNRQNELLDKKRIMSALHDHSPYFPFQTVARDFSMIESHLQPVIIQWDQRAEELIESLNHADKVGGIARQLQPYLVQIPRQGFEALRSAGAVQPVAPERLGDQFWVLINPNLYEKEAGLSWDNPVFIKAENCVF